MNWADFFNMGGYALYVWGAYGVSLLVFIIEVLMVRHKRAVTLRQVRMLNRVGE